MGNVVALVEDFIRIKGENKKIISSTSPEDTLTVTETKKISDAYVSNVITYMIPRKEIPGRVYLQEQRGRISLMSGIARNVKSLKLKKAFSNLLTNSTFFHVSFRFFY